MLVIGKSNYKENETENPVELSELINPRKIDDLIKVTSSRNCNVFKINEDLFLTMIKEAYYKDSLITNFSQRKRLTDKTSSDGDILPIHNIITHEGKVLGYTTDSFDMTLRDFFINEDPSLAVTKIVLRMMRDVCVASRGHGDIDLVNFVLKEGKIFLTNYMMKRIQPASDFSLLNDIEREVLTSYGHPSQKSMPVEQADRFAFNYWYYLLINTSGEERKRLITAGLENIYKTLFDDLPNTHIDEERFEKVKEQMQLKKEYSHDGKLIQHFYINTL